MSVRKATIFTSMLCLAGLSACASVDIDRQWGLCEMEAAKNFPDDYRQFDHPAPPGVATPAFASYFQACMVANGYSFREEIECYYHGAMSRACYKSSFETARADFVKTVNAIRKFPAE